MPNLEFRDAAEFFAGPLELPYKGKKYVIPQADLETGLIIAGVTEIGDLSIVDLYKRLMGPVWDEMTADGVPGVIILRAAETALADAQAGRAIAMLVWEVGMHPEALAAKKAALDQTTNPQDPKASTPSTSTGAASSTRSPASTSGTRSRKTTPRGNAPKATQKK